MKKKRICLFVLSGAYNLGDELLLQSEIDFLKKKYPKARLCFATFDIRSTLKTLRNIPYFSYFPNNIKKHPIRNIGYFFRQTWNIIRSDTIIIGGGGIFFDNEPNISVKKIYWEWYLRLFFARLFRKQVCFFGISLELHSQKNLELFGRLFRIHDRIFVRNNQTQNLLQKLHLFSRVLPDNVFLLSPAPKKVKHTPKTIGWALRSGFLSQTSITLLQKILQTLKKQGYKNIFLSHAIAPSNRDNDSCFAQRYFGEFPITTSLEQTQEAYKKIDILIGMRLHSMILAAQHGLALLPISYSNKTRAFIETFDLQKKSIDTTSFSSDQFFSHLQEIIDQYDHTSDTLAQQYGQIHTKFLQNMEKIDIVEGETSLL